MGAAAFKVARLAKTHDFVVCRSRFHDLSHAPTLTRKLTLQKSFGTCVGFAFTVR